MKKMYDILNCLFVKSSNAIEAPMNTSQRL